ncbi:MAG: pantoate--beta-alanine ligase [Fuerstiella sp.]|nr:pantoate--beta-alanine ligase [Fuerstiella sp.]MCP4510801.1 pantoate--beta-alanine ligase [Fuerstiella sp.]MDG2130164.1 pantoate--beta-alanine ligase [Fuerstiella sp.]
MQVEALPSAVRSAVQSHRCGGRRTGLVPTMGALHVGHVSLLDAARSECDFVIATIFVNPMQFGPHEDFERYPRTLEQDLQRCEAAGVDLVFTPETSRMYAPGAESIVSLTGLTRKLEGRHRPGHFDGVTTVVAKLFNITVPDRAYFGQKDYQQQLIIRRMASDLDWGVEIVTCPIVREDDGLALSSRNRYLSPAEREKSLSLSRALSLAQDLAQSGSESPDSIARRMQQLISGVEGIDPDYAVVVDCDTLDPLVDRPKRAVALIAVRIGKTRLIDNQILRFR